MKKYFFLLLFLTLPACIFAQIGDSLLRESLYREVKQLDEFIERFNYKQDIYGKKITADYPISRPKYLLALFDYQYLKGLDETGKKRCEEFVQAICNPANPFYLDFFKPDWYAQTHCNLSYKNKTEKGEIWLKIDVLQNKTCKWVITNVQAPFLELPPRRNDISVFIPPNSHETNFMALPKETEKNTQWLDYTSQNYTPDILSIFLFEGYQKRLKINHIEKTTFHFFQLNGWAFTVEFFNRSEQNSGWLISKIVRLEGNK